jgi:hypothetical protein
MFCVVSFNESPVELISKKQSGEHRPFGSICARNLYRTIHAMRGLRLDMPAKA